MAQQDDAQKHTVERVMHEFKQGDLHSGGGRRVRNPKQAIAIALSEAGASDRQSPATNRRRLAETTSRERQGTKAAAGDAEPSRAELHAEATARKIPGRSRMTKAALRAALRES